MIIEGKLVQDPELRFTAEGKAVCNFYVDSNKCAAWEELAVNINQHIKVGDKVRIFGYPKERWWTTSEGEKKSTKEFTVNRIQVLERPEAIKYCCYYCAHLNADCMSGCYNALGGLSYMEVCQVEDGECKEVPISESNKKCFETR